MMHVERNGQEEHDFNEDLLVLICLNISNDDPNMRPPQAPKHRLIFIKWHYSETVCENAFLPISRNVFEAPPSKYCTWH